MPETLKAVFNNDTHEAAGLYRELVVVFVRDVSASCHGDVRKNSRSRRLCSACGGRDEPNAGHSSNYVRLALDV